MIKNRSHGKISTLPSNIKKEVENKLLDGFTYQEISDYLKNMNIDVSYSSVGRYGRKYLKKFEEVKIAKDYAKLLAEDNIDRPSTEIHEANNAILNQLLMKEIIDEEISADDKLKIARAVSDLQRAQVGNEKLKIDAKKVRNEFYIAFEILKEKVFESISKDYPDIAEKIIEIADDISNEFIAKK